MGCTTCRCRCHRRWDTCSDREGGKEGVRWADERAVRPVGRLHFKVAAVVAAAAKTVQERRNAGQGRRERGRGVRVREREGGQVRRGRLGRPGRLRPRRRPGRRPPRQQRERQKENHDLSLSPLSLSRSPLLLLPPSRCRCRRWRWQQQRWRQRRHNSAHTHPLSIVNTSPVLDEREGIVALINEDMCFGPSLVP